MSEVVVNEYLARILLAAEVESKGELAELGFLGELGNDALCLLLESCPLGVRHWLWDKLRPEQYWDLLHLLQAETAANLVAALNAEEKELLQQFASPEDLRSLAPVLPRFMVTAILQEQGGQVLKDLEQALSYNDHEIGRYMTTRFISALPETTAGSVVRRLKKRKDYQPDAIFVVDESGHYRGTVAVNELIFADDQSTLSELGKTRKSVDHAHSLLDTLQAVDALDSGGWLPVIKNDELVGAVAIRAIVHALKAEHVDRVVGDSNSKEEDLFTPVRVAAYRRAIWLGINLATAFLASTVISLFEVTLQQVIALAVLMPVVASMGGVAGSQTLTVAVRGIVLNHLNEANLKLVLRKELKIALINGTVWGGVIAVIAIYWFQSYWLGAIIGVAIALNSLAAAWSGTLIPFVLKKFHIDPAISGSVILTTVTDVVGFFIFLGLGALIL